MSKTKIALIQLNRLGDVLQTLMAIRLIKNREQYEITLIARDNFVSALKAQIEEQCDHVIPFQTIDILENFQKKGLEVASEHYLKDFFQQDDETFDKTVNLSFCKTSQYLASIISSKETVGITVNGSNQSVVEDLYSQYCFSFVLDSAFNTMNLTNIFSNLIGVESHNTEEIDQVASDRQSNPKKIIIHPFASHERKRWKPAKWIDLIYLLLKKNPDVKIEIIGSPSEKPEADVIFESPLLEKHRKNIVSHVGTKQLSEMNQVFKGADLFIGHDSLGGHLAAYYNVLPITISLGQVRPHDTTPFINGALNLAPAVKCFPCKVSSQCSFYQCHFDIQTHAVERIVTSYLEAGSFISIYEGNLDVPETYLKNMRMYHSALLDNGQLELNNINAHYERNLDDLFIQFYHSIWTFYFREESYTIPAHEINLSQDVLKNLSLFKETFHGLLELTQFSKKYALELIAQASESRMDEVQQTVERIEEIEHLFDELSNSNPFLKPLIKFLLIRKRNVQGNDILKIGENLYFIFHEFEVLLSTIVEFSEVLTGKIEVINESHASREEK